MICEFGKGFGYFLLDGLEVWLHGWYQEGLKLLDIIGGHTEEF